MSSKDENEFRLRPRKPPVSKGQRQPKAWSIAFKQIMHYARMSRGRTTPKKAAGKPARAVYSRNQRCAVRITYARNATRGQWRAHGRYLARESATFETDRNDVGFDEKGQGTDVAARLEQWQTSQDQRLWKIILSPEFGDRVDLERLTRDVRAQMERDLGTRLEWIAVVHHNTEHPHIHVALRGIKEDGQALQLDRQYIKEGVRSAAEDFCTRQLGHRTDLDAAEAERREINEKRFTSLDRMILKQSRGDDTADAAWARVALDPVHGSGKAASATQQHIAARLAVLSRMGLATLDATGGWRVKRNFEAVLRAMQRVADRQKMLATHGVLMSDERLPVEILDRRALTSVEGRVLVHGEDEISGRSYLMLEGTDAKVHFVHYTPEIEEARTRGGLRTNSFIRMRKLFVDGRPMLDIQDMGHSEAILKNRRHLEQTADNLSKRGILPTEDGWGGWLGRYQAALSATAARVERDREQPGLSKRTGRQRGREPSRGR